MLIDKPEEQNTLFREIMLKRLTVRDSESIARRIAVNKVRKKEYIYSNEVLAMEKKLSEALGTRVVIEVKEHGGKLAIDFMGEEDLRTLFAQIAANINGASHQNPEKDSPEQENGEQNVLASPARPDGAGQDEETRGTFENHSPAEDIATLDDRTGEEKFKDENTFDSSSFSL
jgi:hypothetical protein